MSQGPRSHKNRIVLIALMVAAVALAGCHQPGEDAAADGTQGGDDDTPGSGGGASFQRPERGASLSTSELATLVAAFDDQPLSDSQSPWPAHRLKWVSEDSFIAIHVNNDDPTQATELNWIAIGQKGVFCSEDRPGSEDQWRHFHSYDAPTYGEGHGGDAGESGYWLTHIAARSFEAKWGAVVPGVDAKFMRTPAPDCGSDYDTLKANMDHAGEGDGEGLDAAERAAIQAAMPDQPLSDSQSPWPAHRLLWVSEDTFIGTHWNHGDPSQATEMNWFALGQTGTFCDGARPGAEDDWRHFHSYDAPNYDAGHGGDQEETGYWTVHAAVRSFEAPWGQVSPGVDPKFMHTDAPTC